MLKVITCHAPSMAPNLILGLSCGEKDCMGWRGTLPHIQPSRRASQIGWRGGSWVPHGFPIGVPISQNDWLRVSSAGMPNCFSSFSRSLGPRRGAGTQSTQASFPSRISQGTTDMTTILGFIPKREPLRYNMVQHCSFSTLSTFSPVCRCQGAHGLKSMPSHPANPKGQPSRLWPQILETSVDPMNCWNPLHIIHTSEHHRCGNIAV